MFVFLGLIAAAAQVPAATPQAAKDADPIVCTSRGDCERSVRT